MALGTANRFARAIDRARELSAQVEGKARDWPDAARKAGFLVDKNLAKDYVLVYHGDYGNAISVYSHLARLADPIVKNGKIQIQDSYESAPGLPGKTRELRLVSKPNMQKCSVIHPKR